MVMFYAFVVLFLSGSTFAQVTKSGPCSEVKVQENLKPTEILGRWYEQAKLFTLYEMGSECGVFEYFIDPKTGIPVVNHNFTSSITGKEEFYQTDLLTPDPEEPARLLRKHPLSPIKGYSDIVVLGTDYENWLVSYSCSDVCDMNVNFGWIVTREQVPSESDLASAYAVIRQNNIDTSLFIKVEQEKCRK